MKDINEELVLEEAKPADTPKIVSQSGKMDSHFRAVSLLNATLYRRLVAKLNYLAMDRTDIRYAASTVESRASSPNDVDMVKLKRVRRFQIGRPITWTHYRWWVRSNHIMAYTDSDWAPKREDRRSVSRGMLAHIGGLLRFWSRRQQAVSLSSCEGELCAAVSNGVDALTLQRRLRDKRNNTRVTMRQPRGGGPHRTSGTWVGETRAHKTSLVASGKG